MRKVKIQITAGIGESQRRISKPDTDMNLPRHVEVGFILEADYNELRNQVYFQPPFTGEVKDQWTFTPGFNCEIIAG